VQVLARSDVDPQLDGAVRFADVETKAARRATIGHGDLANYRAVFAEFTDSLRSYFAARRIGWMQALADADLSSCLARLVRTTRDRVSRAAGRTA
jgi:hypothetical protein